MLGNGTTKLTTGAPTGFALSVAVAKERRRRRRRAPEGKELRPDRKEVVRGFEIGVAEHGVAGRALVDQLDRGRLDAVDGVLGTSGVGEDPADRVDHLGVGRTHRAHRSDLAGRLGVEDGGEASDPAVHDLFVDHVGLRDAPLGQCLGRVLDLDGERRPVQRGAPRVGQAR